MPDLPRTRRIHTKIGIAFLLTFVAGIVDIEGFLTVYHLFVAHMTGSTVHFGNMLARGHWVEVANAGTVIFCFVLGAIIGRMAIEVGKRRGLRRIASVTLIAEAILISSAMWIRTAIFAGVPASLLSPASQCMLLGLLSTAMGLQTATLTRVGPLTIHTTFVTGMLNKLAQVVSQWIFWIHDEWKRTFNFRNSLFRSREQESFREARLMLGIWIFYVLGSVVGTSMNALWSARSLYLPILLLVGATIVDQFQPLSIEEENEQA